MSSIIFEIDQSTTSLQNLKVLKIYNCLEFDWTVNDK